MRRPRGGSGIGGALHNLQRGVNRVRDGRPHDREPAVGLCASCVHARVQHTARGSRFWRCALAEGDARFRRYPPLPVRECKGHEDGEPHSSR